MTCLTFSKLKNFLNKPFLILFRPILGSFSGHFRVLSDLFQKLIKINYYILIQRSSFLPRAKNSFVRKIIFQDHKKKYPLANHSTEIFRDFNNFELLVQHQNSDILVFQFNSYGSEKTDSRDRGRRQKKDDGIQNRINKTATSCNVT